MKIHSYIFSINKKLKNLESEASLKVSKLKRAEKILFCTCLITAVYKIFNVYVYIINMDFTLS